MPVQSSLAEIAVSLPVTGTFTYRIPPRIEGLVQFGVRVLVPFGRRRVTGYVVDLFGQGPGKERPPSHGAFPRELKEILDVLDDEPIFDRPMLDLYRWIAEYYFSPLGEVLKSALPGGINVASYRSIALTETGRAAIASRQRKGGMGEILRAVAAEEGLSAQLLERRIGRPIPCSLLYGLRDKGLIEIRPTLQRAAVGPKYDFRCIPRPGTAHEAALEAMRKSAPRRAELFALLLERGGALLSELSGSFPRARELVRRLEADGLATLERVPVARDPYLGPVPEDRSEPPRLTPHQEEAYKELRGAIDRGGFARFLLYGITGSGKTEIYMRAIELVRARGKGALVLVPEISLTPQLISRFRARFGDRIAVLHSGLSRGERYDQWWKIRRGEVHIALGVRSAVFAPVKRLGIVVVDEEHETSYKQEDSTHYNARDLAIMRSKLEEAVVVLGSATPSLESFQNSRRGRYIPLVLPKRVKERPLPKVEVVDMRNPKVHADRRGFFSRPLHEAVGETLERRQQTLLFLNRRGFSPIVMCGACSFVLKCRECSVSLTYHKAGDAARCHYCGFSAAVPARCPDCRSGKIMRLGLGTERLEEDVRARFPEARVERVDRDTVRSKTAFWSLFERLSRAEIDILIGTQMIAKGHDFPGVTLVGAVLADASLHFPDFRSAERTFQLLTQVSGRAGRGDEPGRVIVQTFNPDHYSIRCAREHDFPAFYREEIEYRRELNYPPFSRLVNLRILGGDEESASEAAAALGALARAELAADPVGSGGIQLMGPAPAPISKIQGRHRQNFFIKGARSNLIHVFTARLLESVSKARLPGRGVKFVVDVDPINVM